MMTFELTTVKIGQPASRALKAAGIHTLAQLCDYTEKDLLALHGIGPKAIRILKETLEKEGLSFHIDSER
jgi:DNA-directed RNA polymerase alpha subunit